MEIFYQMKKCKSKNDNWQTVIFIDLDNTIIKGPFESVVFPILFGEISNKSGLSKEEIRQLIVKENFDRQNNSKIPATLAMDWDDIFKTIAQKLGIKISLNIIDIIISHLYPPYSIILDSAYEILKELSISYRAIVAATKGLKKYQIPIIEALGLTPLFTDLLTPDSNNALKKNKSFYGDWPNRTHLQISVGDHYDDDVLYPKKFGFKVIWKINSQDIDLKLKRPFERPRHFAYSRYQKIRPDAIILSLKELPEVIMKLEEKFM